MSAPAKPVRHFLTADLLKRPLDKLAFDDPIEAATAAGELSGLGVEAEIKADVLVTRTLERLKKDQRACDSFRMALVEQKFISRNEADLGSRSPKLSNIAKIANVAHVLLSPELKPYVPSGFQPQYELARLYEELKASNPEDRLEQLLTICERAEGKLTIALIAKERANLAKPKENQPSESSAAQNVSSAADSQMVQSFDLILVTPGAADYEKALKDNSAEPARCMAVSAGDDAVGMLVCHADKLTFSHRKFLRNAGFDDITGLHLVSVPTLPDISGDTVVAISCRGTAVPQCVTHWFDGTECRTLAEAIAPNSTNKLHLFAEACAEGWECVVGDKNWSRG